MNINNIANFTGNFKQNSINQKNKYPNLAPLKKDTVSFGSKLLEKEDSINIDWIDDKEIKKIVTRIFSDGHARLSRKEILSLLKYFNYEFKRNTGDDQYKHKYLNTPSIFTLKAEEPRPAITYTNRFKIAFKNINRTNGELFFIDNVPSDEEIAKFNATVQDCPDEHKNPYRLKLEQHKKQQAQIHDETKRQVLLNNNQNEIVKNSCIKVIEEAKASFHQEYYQEAKRMVDVFCWQYQDETSSDEILSQMQNDLRTIQEKIEALEYFEGDNNITCQKRIDELEEELALIWFNINLSIENKIKENEEAKLQDYKIWAN